MTSARTDLINRSVELLSMVHERPMGPELARWLNETFPPGSTLFDELASLVRTGMAEGWACRDEIYGPHYRRCQILPPSQATYGFSIESVYMNDTIGREHEHPHGEINMIVPLDPNARVDNINAGWTCPEPGSQHFPEVRDGAAIFLYYLPQGEIRFTGR